NPDTGTFSYQPFGPKYFTDHFDYYVTDGYESSRLARVTLVPLLWLVPHSDAYVLPRSAPPDLHQVSLLANDTFPKGANVLNYVDEVILAHELVALDPYAGRSFDDQPISGLAHPYYVANVLDSHGDPL